MKKFLLKNNTQFRENLLNKLRLKGIVFDYQIVKDDDLILIEKTVHQLLKYRPYQRINITINIPKEYVDTFIKKYSSQDNVRIISKKLNDIEYYNSKIIVTNSLKTAYKEFSVGSIIILTSNQNKNEDYDFYYLFNSSEPKYLKDIIVWNYLSSQPEYTISNYLMSISHDINKPDSYNEKISYLISDTLIKGKGVPGKIVVVTFNESEKRRTVVNNYGKWFISLPLKDISNSNIEIEYMD